MTVPDPAVIRRAPRNRELEIGAFESFYCMPAICGQPSVDDFDQALLQRGCLEDAAIEENRRWMNEGFAFGNSRLSCEKGGEVSRDAGILRIRQTHLRQSCPSRGVRYVSD